MLIEINNENAKARAKIRIELNVVIDWASPPESLTEDVMRASANAQIRAVVAGLKSEFQRLIMEAMERKVNVS